MPPDKSMSYSFIPFSLFEFSFSFLALCRKAQEAENYFHATWLINAALVCDKILTY